jgi:hypothetical protein
MARQQIGNSCSFCADVGSIPIRFRTFNHSTESNYNVKKLLNAYDLQFLKQNSFSCRSFELTNFASVKNQNASYPKHTQNPPKFFILTSTAFLLLYSHKKASFLGLYVDNVLHEISLLCQKRMTRHDIIIYDDDKKGCKFAHYCIVHICTSQTTVTFFCAVMFFYSSPMFEWSMTRLPDTYRTVQKNCNCNDCIQKMNDKHHWGTKCIFLITSYHISGTSAPAMPKKCDLKSFLCIKKLKHGKNMRVIHDYCIFAAFFSCSSHLYIYVCGSWKKRAPRGR